jgi:peptidoglycan/LPS O-acetylase OafA/YrhL
MPRFSFTMTAPTTDRLPQLDGLRGAAILFVIWHHFGLHLPGWLDIGPIAPSIFFLLSGYLITRSIMKRPMGPAQMASYHARRLARLLPALYVMLLVGWVAGLEEFRDGLGWHAAFATNFQMVAKDDWSGSLSHLWSLSVQEQFYFVWPLILFLPSRLLPGAFVTFFVGAAVFRAGCLQAESSDFFRWFMLPASFDAFAAGALVAWLMIRHQGRVLVSPRWMASATTVALVCWLIARKLRYLRGSGHIGIAFIDTLETITLAFLLIILLQNLSAPVVRIFSFKPLVTIGRVSYGVYVWHLLVAYAFGPMLDAVGITTEAHDVARCAVLTTVSVGVAWLSWIAIERPFLEWTKRLTTPDALGQSFGTRLARIFSKTKTGME